jgi:glycosyltransferase involved in cell wall biosynthesis
VGYGLDLSLFLPPVEKPEFDVVILGRLHVHKGVLDLPEIWSRVRQSKPDAKLLIIGEGAHRPLVEQGLQKLGLTSSVTFTGGVPEREKNELLARSRIGLSLSFEEGWGLSVNEYLATGLPVVAYHLPIYDEVFPGLLETVPSGNKEAAAANILRLLQNQSLSESIGSRGREFVKRYDYRNVAEAELNGIRTALEKRRKEKEK